MTELREHFKETYENIRNKKPFELKRPIHDEIFKIFLLDLWAHAKESRESWHDLLLWTPTALHSDVFRLIVPWHNLYLTHTLLTVGKLSVYNVECKDYCETCMQHRRQLIENLQHEKL